MKDFIWHSLAYGALAALLVGAIFVFGSTTGRACLTCEAGTAQTIDFQNPDAAEMAELSAVGSLLALTPFVLLLLAVCSFTAIRAAASSSVKKDAKQAKENHEDGRGVDIFG